MYNWYNCSFSRVKLSERGVGLPPLSNAEGEARKEL
jgi:hypothetical protein